MDFFPPQLGPAAEFVTLFRAKTFLVVDVTEIARSWVSGTPNFGIALRGARPFVPDGFGMPVQRPPMAAQFDSKENAATGHLPRLQIVLAPSAP